MFDCAKDILAYHDDEVTLPQPERTEMRQRRNSNRDRLTKGLAKGAKPPPREFASQGSYAMKTMVRHPTKDYDIDDGVYFDKEQLVGDRGAEFSALQARQMVRDALDDGSFKVPPEVRPNCVRVYYIAGYHVDVPVYRRIVTKDILGNESQHYELASSDWKRSDARDVTSWFESENHRQSPDASNGRQLRRIVRQLKRFARSRESWSKQILSGFGITRLVTECFQADADREDMALYETMRAIRNRLNYNLVVTHPVTPAQAITNGSDDPRARFLRDRLTQALEALEPLSAYDCTRKIALKCWGTVFATTFFADREASATMAAASLLKGASVPSPAHDLTFPDVPRADDRPRGFG